VKNLTPKYHNSAGRLLAILESLKSNQPVVNELGPLFFGEAATQDVKHKSLLGIKSITQLHIIYANFVEDLENAEMGDEEKAVLMKGLASLTTLMYPTSTDQGMRVVSEAEKALLEVCATRLPKENVIETEDIELILSSIQELKDLVVDLPEKSVLKTILLELIRLSEDAISRFNIYGAKGLKTAFKGMLAEVAEVYLQDEEDVSEIRDNKGWKKVTNHLKTMDKVAAKVMKYKPLIEKTSNFLLGS